MWNWLNFMVKRHMTRTNLSVIPRLFDRNICIIYIIVFSDHIVGKIYWFVIGHFFYWGFKYEALHSILHLFLQGTWKLEKVILWGYFDCDTNKCRVINSRRPCRLQVKQMLNKLNNFIEINLLSRDQV